MKVSLFLAGSAMFEGIPGVGAQSKCVVRQVGATTPAPATVPPTVPPTTPPSSPSTPTVPPPATGGSPTVPAPAAGTTFRNVEQRTPLGSPAAQQQAQRRIRGLPPQGGTAPAPA